MLLLLRLLVPCSCVIISNDRAGAVDRFNYIKNIDISTGVINGGKKGHYTKRLRKGIISTYVKCGNRSMKHSFGIGDEYECNNYL